MGCENRTLAIQRSEQLKVALNIFKNINDSLKFKLEEYEKFYCFTENAVNKSECDYKTWYDKISKDMSQEEKEGYIDDFISFENHRQFLNDYSVITLYSLLESTLLNLCRHIERKPKIQFKLDEIKRDRGITKAKKYICKNTKVLRPLFRGDYWNHFLMLGRVRNCLMHNGGKIQSGKKGDKIRGDIRKNPRLLDIAQPSKIVVKRKLLPHSLRNIEKFMHKLHQKLNMVYEK